MVDRVDNGAFNTLANINVAVPNGKEKKSLDPSLLAITSLPVPALVHT